MATSSATPNHYYTLGVTRDASLEEIKKAYKRLALQHHPDKNNGDRSSTEKFKLIASAWEILQDREKRRAYDATCPRSAPATKDPGEGADSPESAEAYAREQQEAARKHKEWVDWSTEQDREILEVVHKLKKLENEIEQLKQLDRIAKERLAEKPPWYTFFTPWDWDKPVVSDDEKLKMERDRLQRNAARTVKLANIKTTEKELQALRDERARGERIALQRSQEARRKREQYMERQRKFQEEELRRKQQQEAAKRREAEREAAQEAAKWARKKEAQERAARAKEAEEAQKIAEQLRMRREARAQEHERARNRYWENIKNAKEEKQYQGPTQENKRSRPSKTTKSPKSCNHKYYWSKSEGLNFCRYCQRWQNKFVLNCPGCSAMACYSCMKDLKWGLRSAYCDDHEDSGEDLVDNGDDYFGWD